MKYAAIAVLAAPLMAFAAPAYAGNAQAEASARVLTQVTITITAPVQFGTIIPDDDATGYVSIAAEGSVSECTVSGCFGLTSPAKFVVNGSAGDIVTLSHAGTALNPVTFSITNGTDSTTFGVILQSPMLTLNASGQAEFNMGARIVIPAGLPAGDYTGQFEITVNYQ